MKNAKQLLLLFVAAFVFAVPFVHVERVRSMPSADHSGMSLSSGDCASQCTNTGQVSSAAGIERIRKDDEQEPAPPLAYWQLRQPLLLATLYVLLPTVFLFIVYKNPRILRSTQLRF